MLQGSAPTSRERFLSRARAEAGLDRPGAFSSSPPLTPYQLPLRGRLAGPPGHGGRAEGRPHGAAGPRGPLRAVAAGSGLGEAIAPRRHFRVAVTMATLSGPGRRRMRRAGARLQAGPGKGSARPRSAGDTKRPRRERNPGGRRRGLCGGSAPLAGQEFLPKIAGITRGRAQLHPAHRRYRPAATACPWSAPGSRPLTGHWPRPRPAGHAPFATLAVRPGRLGSVRSRWPRPCATPSPASWPGPAAASP